MQTKGNEPKKADAILTADWHIRADVPKCRTDDYLKAQWEKVEFIQSLATDHECPIVIAGDIGHRPHWPNWLLTRFMRIWVGQPPCYIAAALGQHDLPNHNQDKFPMSGVAVLRMAHAPRIAFAYMSPDSKMYIQGADYGQAWALKEGYENIPNRILVAHKMVIEDKPLWPGQLADNAQTLLRKHPKFQLIVTGDNHLPFVAEREGRLLVNPGSMMRMTADQADHRPRVYLWYAETNTVEPVYLPIEDGVVSREHIDNAKGRDERMEAFISRAGEQYDVGLSFTENLTRFFDANPRTRRAIREKVWAAVGGEE